MALPLGVEARVFYQAAQQRFQDARFLMNGKRITAAVYLAGYAVECVLKAMVLASTPRRERVDVVASFRGSKAHDFAWLRTQYHQRGGPQIPRDIAGRFALVNTWSTSLRYKPGSLKQRDGKAFINAAQEILTWANGRL